MKQHELPSDSELSISDKPPKTYKKFDLAFKEERGDEYEAA